MAEIYNKYEKRVAGDLFKNGSNGSGNGGSSGGNGSSNGGGGSSGGSGTGTGTKGPACPTVVILTFEVLDATAIEVDVAGPINCPVPKEGQPVISFIQCLILQGYELLSATQGGIDNNFVTYIFVRR